jgi:2-polyprenyl-6-methoxyphenol hydroxylase-like FAD-dependent oxidoreductase
MISGGGIAGLVCAIWLGRAGIRPVVIEKAPDIRADGFIVSLSHHAYRFALEMGIMPALEARQAGISASSYHAASGRTLLKLDYQRLFAELDVIQIMRDDLQAVLYEAAHKDAEFRFGLSVSELTQDAHGVSVVFTDGSEDRFDLVIAADGLHSKVRDLGFPDSALNKRYLGLSSAAYRLPNVLGLRDKFETYTEAHRYMAVYTTRDNELACVFVWASDERAAPRPEQRWSELHKHFAGSPPQVQQVLDNYPDTETMYMDPLIQVELQRWHRERIAVVGDAAHCMTLISGQGASAAFSGASHLSKALLKNPHEEAFSVYQQVMAPVVSEIQPATRQAAQWYVPRSNFKYLARNSIMAALPNVLFQRYFQRKYSKT